MGSGYDGGSVGKSGSDIGLLVLRLAVGAAILQAGLIKALDFNATVGFMEASGWRAPTFAAFMVTAAETAGGIGLLLGLLTPLAALAVTAAMIDAWAVNVSGGAFWSDPFNVPFLIGTGAVALLFTGAGRYSLDERFWGRASWPRLIAIIIFVLAIIAAVATWAGLNGTNPIHVTAPPK
jgi:putative oxidoreductase